VVFTIHLFQTQRNEIAAIDFASGYAHKGTFAIKSVHMQNSSPGWLRSLINYFLRGLLFIAPLFLTGYALYFLFTWMDGLINGMFPQLFPGAGVLILIVSITFIGVLTKWFLFQWMQAGLENFLSRTPVTKLIYSSLKDLFSAFVGNKKMFTQPVMVLLFKDAGIQKLGFVTKNDLSAIGIKEMVAVYFPHSYNFSGNLYLVPSANVTPIHNWNSADAMKFIVSGGVTEIKGEQVPEAGTTA
jgi:uncharacterized membrane protein